MLYLAGQGFRLHSRRIDSGFSMPSQKWSWTTPLFFSSQRAFEACVPPPQVTVHNDQSENTHEYSGARSGSFFGIVYS